MTAKHDAQKAHDQLLALGVATETNRNDFFTRFNITSIDQINESNRRNQSKLQAMFPEFDFVLTTRALIIQTARDRLFPKGE